MRNGAEGIKVVSIMGEDYSIKAPAGQEQALLDAALMLKAALAETKKKYPTLIGDKLLVLTAMNLCSKQLDLQKRHQQELERYQEQVSATVEVIAKTINQG